MSLAKLVIAAAWVDGELSASEINVLKDLIYSWGDIGEEDWTELEAYLDHPVREAERERLLALVLDSIISSRDKRLVIDTLSRLVEADGEVTRAEQEALQSIRQAVDSKGTGLGGVLSLLVGGAIKKKSGGAAGPNREERLEDFVRNGIYFQLQAEMEHEGMEIDLSEDELRKLCLGAGLLSQVAWLDKDVSDREREAMCDVLKAAWDLNEEAARLVCRISIERSVKDLDSFRLARSFFEATTHDERRAFLRSLFEVANSCSRTSFEEIEEIRRIARSLKLSHDDFIEAKLSISAEDRAGL